MLTGVSARVLFWVSGLVFGIIWAVLGGGWAAIVVLCGLAGFYVGAIIEHGFAMSSLLDPLRNLAEPLRHPR